VIHRFPQIMRGKRNKSVSRKGAKKVLGIAFKLGMDRMGEKLLFVRVFLCGSVADGIYAGIKDG